MRRIIPAILALATLMCMSSLALAQEPAKYNFASIQGIKELKILPGSESTRYIYFYNIDGNRITHVILEITQAPAGWQVEIQPPLGETQVEVNGQVVTVTENLYIEPSEVQIQEIKDVPEGMVCLTVPERGYALAKEAKMIVRVPDTEAVGTTGEITVSATASWLGQGGAASLNQSRDFTFTVEVVPERTEFHEKIVDKNSETISKWLPTIIGVAVVVVGAIMILLLRRRRE